PANVFLLPSAERNHTLAATLRAASSPPSSPPTRCQTTRAIRGPSPTPRWTATARPSAPRRQPPEQGRPARSGQEARSRLRHDPVDRPSQSPILGTRGRILAAWWV